MMRMTEKRFILKGDYLVDKKGMKYAIKECNDATKDYLLLLLNALHDENEQLKQQEKRLYNYFRKCFDNVSEQGFQETWEVVKKYG